MECTCKNLDNPYFADWLDPEKAKGTLSGAMNAPTLPPNMSTQRFMFGSNIAPQLAWWLAFFPPERFTFILSSDLKTKEGARKVCC